MKRRINFVVDERVVEALDRIGARLCTTRTGALVQIILKEEERAERGEKKPGKSGLGGMAGVRD